MTTDTVVTGVPTITSSSIVQPQVRIEATPEHSTDDLLIDPIRLAVHSLVAGVGFTVRGAMDNAPANGTYTIDWTMS